MHTASKHVAESFEILTLYVAFATTKKSASAYAAQSRCVGIYTSRRVLLHWQQTSCNYNASTQDMMGHLQTHNKKNA